MLKAVYDSLSTIVYPQACRICKKSVETTREGIACGDCWVNTRIFSGTEILCSKCGAFLSQSGNRTDTLCRRCDEHFYDSARAVGIYEHALAASVLHLKKTPSVCTNLQHAFLSTFSNSSFQDSTLIVPVPLSKKRFLERGFNQAVVLAKILEKKTAIQVDEKSLARKIHTPMHRAAMDKKAREMSVRNAFEVTRPKLIRDAVVLLVDDLFTSGATASYCAKVLKKNGAEKVYVLTLARAV